MLTLPRCPTWGYPTESAYYRDASSTDAILSIKIPFLAISAIDDPVRISLVKYSRLSNKAVSLDCGQRSNPIRRIPPEPQHSSNHNVPRWPLVLVRNGWNSLAHSPGMFCLLFRINRMLKTADMNVQVCNFLNHLAFKADLDDLTPMEYPPKNKAFAGSDYNPMRRKMNIVRS